MDGLLKVWVPATMSTIDGVFVRWILLLDAGAAVGRSENRRWKEVDGVR